MALSPKDANVSVIMPKKMLVDLKKIAKENRRGISAMVRDILRDWGVNG